MAVAALYPDSYVLAADTVVAMGRRIMGKPEHKAMAEKLSDATVWSPSRCDDGGCAGMSGWSGDITTIT